MRTDATRARNVVTRGLIAACVATLIAGLATGPASAQNPEPATAESAPARPTYRHQLGTRASADSTANVMPYQPYTDWTWPTQGHTSTTETLTIDQVDPGSHYFWAYDFTTGGNGVGYSGLQTGAWPNNNKIALFAIWGADAAQGTNCEAFDGEGLGWTCRLDPFAWTIGHSYILRVALDGTDSHGTWYQATIRNTTTGAHHTIGRIHHPTPNGKITGRGSWTEWFGNPTHTCQDIKRSKIRWSHPTAQNGRTKTTSHTNHTEPKDGSTTCPDATTLTDTPTNVTQTVAPK